MASQSLDALVKDEKKMRKLIAEGIPDADRPAMWKKCIEYRSGYPIGHPLPLPSPCTLPQSTSPLCC